MIPRGNDNDERRKIPNLLPVRGAIGVVEKSDVEEVEQKTPPMKPQIEPSSLSASACHEIILQLFRTFWAVIGRSLWFQDKCAADHSGHS